MAVQTAELRMHHALIVGSRILVGLIGAAAYYLALFLYEDEQKVIQNRLVDLWVAVYSRAEVTESTTTALFNKIGELLNNLFNRVLGVRKISLQAAFGSSNFSLILPSFIVLAEVFEKIWPTVPVMLGLTILVILPAYVNSRWLLLVTGIPIAAILFFSLKEFFVTETGFGIGTQTVIESISLLMAFSLLTDYLAIIIIRRLFASIAKTVSVVRIAVIMATLIAYALLILTLPQYIHAFIPIELLENAVEFLPAMNLSTSLLCLFPVIMLAGVLIHRIIWPLLSRVVHSISRYQTLTTKKTLIPIGTLCFTFAFNLGHVGIKELVKLFG